MNTRLSRSQKFFIALIAVLVLLAGILYGPQIAVIGSLHHISPGNGGAVPYASEKLDASSWRVRAAAARALATIGPPAEPAVPRLIRALGDESMHVATTAAIALGTIKSPQPQAVTALTNTLQHPNPELRRYAAYALSRYGKRAQAAVPQLIKALEDPRSCYNAAVALQNLAVTTPEALPGLSKMLKSSLPHERTGAILALSNYKTLPKDMVVALENLQHDEDPVVRRVAESTPRSCTSPR